jgi:hypothetical protein
MARARKRRRKIGGLRDIGPQTRRYAAVRDGIRGMSRALDRGACKDAAALLKLTERAMRGVPVLRAEREFFEEEHERFTTSCKRKR